MLDVKSFFRVFGSFDPKGTIKVVLACWAAILLVFAVLPTDSTGRMLVAADASWTAEAFAGIALVLALLKSTGAGRIFWALFGGAVFVRYAGDLVWTGSGLFGVQLLPAHQALADALSYPLFFAALLWLAKRSRQEVMPVAALDTLGAMLSSGLLLWYLVLGSGISPTELDGWEDFVDLAQPVCDLGLFLLVLGVLLKVRSPFVAFLAGGLLLFLLTDGSYLELRANGPYVVGGWPVLLWAGGVALLGVAAHLQRGSDEPLGQGEGEPQSGNLETFLFWLGPLSPPLQFGALLVWGAFRPPLPGYVLLCGGALLAVLALRTYAANHVGGLLIDKRETSTREFERRRIMGELHDTVKQNVRGTSMTAEACKEAHERGDRDEVRNLLDRTFKMSREAERQLCESLYELRLFCREDAPSPTAFFRERFERFEEFGLKTHEDLEAPLETLSRRELVVAYRVCQEVSWNTVKHSNARNLWLESHQVGSVFVLRVRDDGRGFVPEEATEGLGLSLMRSRAEEVGAGLDVLSAPGRGTTVQLRFDTR